MSQIKTKFIEDNAINGAKARLRNNEALRARNAAGSADVDLIKLNAADAREIPGALSLAGNKITNVADPTSAQDVATKAFVEALIQAAIAGMDPKPSVRVATTANITLSGTQTIDGVAVVAGDRVLVKNQTAGAENGIYVAASGAWSRAADADTSSEVTFGMFCSVDQGATYSRQVWFLTTPDPITLGTTALTFEKFSGAGQLIAGNGVSITGDTLSTKVGAGLSHDGSGNQAVNAHSTNVSGTTKINVSNQVEGLKRLKSVITLSGADITNQYVDLAVVAHTDSVIVRPDGGPTQREGTDYSLSYQGGTGSKTRILFAGDLATGGTAALVAGEKLYVECQYL